MTKRERARPMSPEERREAIVAAVLPLLVQYGAAVTTRQIAEAAGIAEGTIFRVFPDKRALFLAVAQDAVDPTDARDELVAALAGVVGLRARVEAAVTLLVSRMEQAMAVMMAVRPALMSERPDPADAEEPQGPPRFVVEANELLLLNLRELLFDPHRAELRVTPAHAALALRSLVFGAWHPGMTRGDEALTPADVAAILLDGVLPRTTAPNHEDNPC